MAEIVFSGIDEDAGLQAKLFRGIKFWLSHKVPQRSRFVNDVRANGGEVVPLEKQADVRIVDHARKEIPPGSHSYRFVEKSLRNGELEDLDDHQVGPPQGQTRSIGSVIQPAKETRQKFTADDDRILWNWVHEKPQKGGGTRGNEIYKQLEEKHPHHPWQSWRDRWVKYLEGKPRPFPLPHNAPPTPPSDVPALVEHPKAPLSQKLTTKKPRRKESPVLVGGDADPFDSFTEADADALLSQGEDILNIHEDNTTKAWNSWASQIDKDNAHTAQQWQAFWEEYVRPRYLRRKAKQIRKAASAQSLVSKSYTPSPSKKLDATPPSIFSPFAKSHRNTEAASRSSSYHLESPSMQLTGRTLVQEAFRSPTKEAIQTRTAEAVRSGLEIAQAAIPSYQPGTPSKQLTGRALFQEASKSPSKVAVQISTSQALHAARDFIQAEKGAPSPQKERIKRKRVALEEEIPSSSPLQPSFSPKRRRQSAAGLPLEIASTPEGSPLARGGNHSSPLLFDFGEQANRDVDSSEDGIDESGSPLGQQLSDTLSEPCHRFDDTQTVFRAPTQPLDFDVPPPEEGWDDLEDGGEWDATDPEIPETEQPDFLVPDKAEELGMLLPGETQELGLHVPNKDDGLMNDKNSGADASKAGSGSEPESFITEAQDRQIIIQETQAILRAQTEPPDFTIAEPDGGWENLIPPSPPPMSDFPRAESEGSSDTDAQMQVWIDEQVAAGVTADKAAWVLTCTSLDTELAEEVVRYLVQNGQLPQRRRGVWTELDDDNLQSTDARKIQWVEDKHGKEGIKTRWDFLNDWKS